MNNTLGNDAYIRSKNGEIMLICSPNDSTVTSLGGLYVGDNPLYHVLPSIILQLVLFFGVSKSIYYLLRPLKQPRFVCDMVAAIILGPSVIGFNWKMMEPFFIPKGFFVVNTIGSLASMWYMFIFSVKMDMSMVMKSSKKVWGIALSCIFTSLTMNLAGILLFRGNIPAFGKGIFLIVAAGGFSQTFFPVIAYGLKELNLLNSDLGQLALACAMVNELISWSMLPVAISAGPKSELFLYQAVLAVLALLLITIYVLRPPLQWIVRNTPEGKPVKEVYIVGIWVVALFMGFLTLYLGGIFAAGVAMVGLVIPDGPPLGATIVEKSELIISEFFLPFFYLAIGNNMDFFGVLGSTKEFVSLFMMTVVGFFARVIGACLSFYFVNIKFENALLLGLVLNIRGLVEMVLFQRWRLTSLIGNATFATLVLSNILITAVVTPLIQIFYNPETRLDMSSSPPLRARSIQTTQKTEEFRILCCIHDEEEVNTILTLIEASNPTEESPICAYMIHLVDLVGRLAPLLVHQDDERTNDMPNRSDRIMHACTNYAKSSRGPVSVQFSTLISAYESMHETVYRLAQDHLVSFIIIPFQTWQGSPGRIGKLRFFNSSMQAHAPCTVGILVTRESNHLHLTNFSFSVAVVFLGGADDREALSLAIRMSRHPNVKVTLKRVDFPYDIEDEDHQRDWLVDKSLLNEFKAMNYHNPCVSIDETKTSDISEAMKTIKSMDNSYDLVIVGRRRTLGMRLEERMKDWEEFEELGLIGDMVASPDFHEGMMPVLVVQHPGEIGSVENHPGSNKR